MTKSFKYKLRYMTEMDISYLRPLIVESFKYFLMKL